MRGFWFFLFFSPALLAQSKVADSSFVALRNYGHDFEYDLKYATKDNFLQAAVYDCPVCYLRFETVRALIAANDEFVRKGYRIKLFDCYRPLSVQRKMWQIVPDPRYVADPSKGSIHNRGGAVDLTLVDKEGTELDMGTKFDFFGPEAGHGFENLSPEVKRNRRLLCEVLERHGFVRFESEWWHYNLKDASKYPVSNQQWTCP